MGPCLCRRALSGAVRLILLGFGRAFSPWKADCKAYNIVIDIFALNSRLHGVFCIGASVKRAKKSRYCHIDFFCQCQTLSVQFLTKNI